MTLPVSGAISFNNINVELGVAGTTQASLGQTSYRTLAGVPSGAISMSNFYGKSNAFTATISSNQTNLNLATWATANGWNGTSAAQITIGSGVWIYSTSTATPALTTGSFPAGLTIINNGFIAGMGGVGGGIDANAFVGGPAISLGVSVTINNTNASAYIGGGGGGGGSMVSSANNLRSGGGGGAGGAAGGRPRNGQAGGAGGGPGAAGSNGTGDTQGGSGGGGGRIFPGVGGARRTTDGGGNGGGSGGGGGLCLVGKSGVGGGGGSGSSNGENGSVAATALSGGGGGGGWGATGGSGAGNGTAPGAAGGKAVALNGYSVTWTSGDTTRVYGAVS